MLARHLVRNPLLNQNIDAVARAIVVENKWRAQRYGVRGTFVSEIGAVGVAEMLDQLIEEIAPDAEALGCLSELRRCRTIVGAGTSADTQLAVFERAHGNEQPPRRLARRHRMDCRGDAALRPEVRGTRDFAPFTGRSTVALRE